MLKVIRDRIRTLLVVDQPTWDERFLRGLLRQDANIDLGQLPHSAELQST